MTFDDTGPDKGSPFAKSLLLLFPRLPRLVDLSSTSAGQGCLAMPTTRTVHCNSVSGYKSSKLVTGKDGCSNVRFGVATV